MSKNAAKPAERPVQPDAGMECLIAIGDGFNLLIPADTVAEVVAGITSELRSNPDAPWLSGTLRWRGMTLPLVSFEQCLLGRDARIRGSHTLVFYGTEKPDELPFYAVTVQAYPHRVRIQSESEIEIRVDDRCENTLMATTVRGIAAVIPDLPAIEKRVVALQSAD